MAFKDNILEFYDDKIIDTSNDMEVMMSWEAPTMEKTADFICSNGGDILEIGFGMGICSDFIQSHSIDSHTIIELHPQILEKLNVWAENKPNVTIIEGDWSSIVIDGTYDGIFLDTFGDYNLSKFKNFALAKIKSGGNISFWNNGGRGNNPHSFDIVTYETVPISPAPHKYTSLHQTYYMPKVEM